MSGILTRVLPRACAGLLLAAAVGGGASADDSSFTSTAGLGNATGEQIYSRICQGCHMPGATGAVGAGRYPRLAGDPALASWQYAALTVLNGRNGMPAFGLAEDQSQEIRAVHLSDTQVAGVVNYVRSNFGNRYKPSVTAQQVAALSHPGTAPHP